MEVILMGHRHNTLSDNIFRNSKYINALEHTLEITDFRKEYKEQYDIMLDVFKTLIKINNILFADSNKNLYDKKIEILDTLTIALYGSLESDDVDTGKYKYSTRTIKNLIDSHTRHLFNKFIEWYDYLSNINELDFVKKEVEEEMSDLESVEFDSVVKENISYKKNKDSDYKIYISKLDYLYPNQQEKIIKYKQEFYDIYGVELQEQEMNDVCLIYKLIACGNNGIVKLFFDDSKKEFGLNEMSFSDNYFNAYLQTLNINMENSENFQQLSKAYTSEIAKTMKALTKYVYSNICTNKHILDVIYLFKPDEYVSNSDLYFFYINMDRITTNDLTFTIRSDLLLKIVRDLKEVYALIYDNVPTMNDKSQVQEALIKIQKIIERNQKLFERVS